MGKPFRCIFSVFSAVILLLLSPISAQTRGNIAVGRSLLATKNGLSWHSPSEEFAFGFHELSNSSNLFLLAIWYAKIPDTVVWYANEGNPVPQGSNVTLTAEAGLVLKDPQGTHLWNTSSEWNGAFVVSYGLMDDTGNFVLRSHNNASVWESFQHPTDTLLPSQIMGRGEELISRLSETNYTKGRFRLALQTDGNLVLGNRELTSGFPYDPYYHSPNQGYQFVFNESGLPYIVSENGTMLYSFTSVESVSPSDYYQRGTLNFYGVFTWYSHPRRFTIGDDNRWTASFSIPDNICTDTNGKGDSGACGHNSICEYDDATQRPSCSCPPHYSLLDPSDMYSSCQPNFKLPYCEDGQDAAKGGYQLVQVQKTDWPDSDYAQLENSSEEECKTSCLNDCFCLAAISSSGGGGAGSCWKKMLPLSNGRTDKSRTAWLKVRNDTNSIYPFAPMNLPSKAKSKTKNTVTSVLLGGSAFINMALLSAIIIGIFFFYKKKQPQLLKPLEESGHVRCFSYKVLEDATNGFSEELGRGAFGVVYKGMLTAGNSQNAVAIKKLDRMSNDTDKEFQSEVKTIGKTHHRNLVHLVGYCKEEDQRLLVYEYMSNGTLAEFLFGDIRPSWVGRVQIAQGIARGLLYLHEECSTQIIHCDIKPQNILLDEYFRARISDFGLAKLLVLNQTHTNTAIRGTKGYVAPEWFRNKPITVKVDVYSFGVLLLEIVCCRRNVCMTLIEEEGAILTDKAVDCYRSNTLHTMVENDMEALEDSLRLKRFLLVALWCVQEDPSVRPTMRMVSQMLDGLAAVPEPPTLPSFSLTGT